MIIVAIPQKWEVHKMYKQLEDESSKPASEAELAKHNKPTIVKIPSNASKVANRLDLFYIYYIRSPSNPFCIYCTMLALDN